MQFGIEVINVKKETKPTAKGSYTQLDVAYKRLDTGKIEGKKIMSFTNKDVFSTLENATNGTQFTVDSEKNEKTTYWDWVKVSPLSGSSSSVTQGRGSSPTPKSTYETPEERAARQVMIVRQSSLAQAVATLSINPGKDKLQIEDVLKLADTYHHWVMQTEDKFNMGFDDMQDDIPM